MKKKQSLSSGGLSQGRESTKLAGVRCCLILLPCWQKPSKGLALFSSPLARVKVIGGWAQGFLPNIQSRGDVGKQVISLERGEGKGR